MTKQTNKLYATTMCGERTKHKDASYLGTRKNQRQPQGKTNPKVKPTKNREHLRDGVEGVVVEADTPPSLALVHHTRDSLRGLVELPRKHALLDEVVERDLVVLARFAHRLQTTEREEARKANKKNKHEKRIEAAALKNARGKCLKEKNKKGSEMRDSCYWLGRTRKLATQHHRRVFLDKKKKKRSTKLQ